MVTEKTTHYNGRPLRVDEARAAWREIDGDIVVVDVTTAEYLTMNGSAALLWDALVSGATAAELCRQLVDAYDISLEQATTDVGSFLDALLGRELISAVA